MLSLLFARRYLFSAKSHSVINVISAVSVVAVGVPIAAMIILMSVFNGFAGLVEGMQSAFDADLERNWAVVAEGIQTILRRENYPNPYEALKALTRTNRAICKEDIAEFIDNLDVSEEVKIKLRALSPQTYTGVFKL